MTILATRALLHDAPEARAALIVVRARLGQDNELLSLPCLGLAGDAAIWRVCWDACAHVMFTRSVFTPAFVSLGFFALSVVNINLNACESLTIS